MKIKQLLNFYTSTSMGFEYGDLAAIHPGETYAQLKTRRLSNYSIFKNILEGSGVLNLYGLRLEIHIPSTSDVIQNDSIDITGVSSASSQVIVYPFTPSFVGSTNYKLINARYGDVHNISNVTIKSPYRTIFYEHYDCVLRKSGVANAIEITGSVRDGFWDGLQAGDTVVYSWGISQLGEKKIIQSIDEGNSLIYLTTNITASISSDTVGDFGTDFPEDISAADYATYGESWYTSGTGFELIGGSPAAQYGDDYNLILTNTVLENTGLLVNLAMGTAKITTNNVTLKSAAVGLSFFVRGYAGGQTMTINNDLIVENNGFSFVGCISALDTTGIYGAGGYLHDSVIVQCNGTLRLVDNLAASWRQYSSGYNPANVGTNYYESIIESGSGEYCILTSNVSPTTINYIETGAEVRLRHDTIINGGTIGDTFYSYNLDFGTGSRTVEVNDVAFSGNISLALFNTAELNNCHYTVQLYSSIATMIGGAPTTTINGGTVYKNASVGTWSTSTGVASGSRGSNLFNTGPTLTITDLVFDGYFYMYMFDCGSPQQPYTEKDFDIQLSNIDIKCYQVWLDSPTNTAGTISRIFTGANVVINNYLSSNNAGRSFPQNISGLAATLTKSVTSSKALANYGTISNVLEIDHQHNYYETSGTVNAIHATNTWSGAYSGNTVYGRNIRLYAVGGNITLKTFDASLRPTSNIIGTNDTIITTGNYLDLTIDNDYILKSGTLQVSEEVILTGNGASTSFRNVLANFILDNTVIANFKCGAIDINCDAAGNFTHADVVGFLDYGTGKFQFIFDNPLGNGVQGKLTYNKPNAWLGTGAWII